MRLYTYISVFLLSNFIYSQELKTETKLYLEDLNKRNKDTLDIITPRKIFEIGYNNSYYGRNERGEELMQFGFRNMKDLTPEDIRHSSVQNTKNGFFVQAIEKLDKACSLDATTHGYYGWVLLFFYHDYKRALEHFNSYDNLTPTFSDVANGDDIHFLKGIAEMKLGNYKNSINEFNLSERIANERGGKLNFPFELQLYKGRCYEKIGNYSNSLKCYDTANKIAEVADNYYYKGMLLKKMKKGKQSLYNLEKAYQLIKVGRKNRDNYYEVFEEIYIQDVVKELEKAKK
jgi:tetratricopeptide (TPR) repeat protein